MESSVKHHIEEQMNVNTEQVKPYSEEYGPEALNQIINIQHKVIWLPKEEQALKPTFDTDRDPRFRKQPQVRLLLPSNKRKT